MKYNLKNMPGFGDPITWPRNPEPDYDMETLRETVEELQGSEINESVEAVELIEDMGITNRDLVLYFVFGETTNDMKAYMDTLKSKREAALDVAVENYIDDCEQYRKCRCKTCVC